MFKEEDEDKFFDTLVSSPGASNMWKAIIDMITLANFTNMEIEVWVYDHNTVQLEEPPQTYKPDPELPWKQEDTNSLNYNRYEKMKLWNWKNSHFNLIIKANNPLMNIIMRMGAVLILIRLIKQINGSEGKSECWEISMWKVQDIIWK